MKQIGTNSVVVAGVVVVLLLLMHADAISRDFLLGEAASRSHNYGRYLAAPMLFSCESNMRSWERDQ